MITDHPFLKQNKPYTSQVAIAGYTCMVLGTTWCCPRDTLHAWGAGAICWAIWKNGNKACFEKKMIKNHFEIICHASALMQ